MQVNTRLYNLHIVLLLFIQKKTPAFKTEAHANKVRIRPSKSEHLIYELIIIRQKNLCCSPSLQERI